MVKLRKSKKYSAVFGVLFNQMIRWANVNCIKCLLSSSMQHFCSTPDSLECVLFSCDADKHVLLDDLQHIQHSCCANDNESAPLNAMLKIRWQKMTPHSIRR